MNSTPTSQKELRALRVAVFIAPILIGLHMTWIDNSLGSGRWFSELNDKNVSELAIFNFLYLTQDAKIWLGSMAAILLAVIGTHSNWSTRLAESISKYRHHISILLLLLLCISNITIYKNQPLGVDEYTQFFQAHVFAQGRLSWTFPPELLPRLILSDFWNYFIAVNPDTGKVTSMYWPGYALLLAPFAWLGIPWLLNPLLTVGSLLMIHDLAQRITGQAYTGGWAMLLAIASSAFIFTGISYYAMSAHLALNLIFVWLVTQPFTRVRLILAGLVSACALNLHNPLPHLIFALPWWCWICLRKRDGWHHATWLALGCLPLALVIGWGWFSYSRELAGTAAQQTGTLTTGISSIRQFFNLLGMDWPSMHTVSIRSTSLAKLWLWAVPGLLILAAQATRRYRQHPQVLLWATSAMLMFCVYLFVQFDQGHGWGYRYFHPAWAALPILASLILAPGQLEPSGANDEQNQMRAFVGALAVCSALVLLPLQALQMHQFIDWHLAHRLNPLPAVEQTQVVFVFAPDYWYNGDLVQNTPMREKAVYLMSGGLPVDTAVMARSWPQSRLLYQNQHGSVWAVQ